VFHNCHDCSYADSELTWIPWGLRDRNISDASLPHRHRIWGPDGLHLDHECSVTRALTCVTRLPGASGNLLRVFTNPLTPRSQGAHVVAVESQAVTVVLLRRPLTCCFLGLDGTAEAVGVAENW
jgi:hypothetical protein